MEIYKHKIAIVAGATGLVGEQLLIQLLSEPAYDKVIAVVRKPLGMVHEKLQQQVIDFGQMPAVIGAFKADNGYCCLGTTIKTAGSKEKQYVVDHDYVVQFAKGCQMAGVTRFAVVSSIGANAASSNFYLRTKGEMERDLKLIHFKSLQILQPSFLLGERKEFRSGEKLGIILSNLLNPLMVGGLKKYRGVHASAVAKSMITRILTGEDGSKIIRSDEI
jgi:uncharacterized protein YbjT (DUF2867 family)